MSLTFTTSPPPTPRKQLYKMTYATFKDIDDALVLFVGTEAISADLRMKDIVFILALQNITTLWIGECSEVKSILDKKSEDLYSQLIV